MPSWLARTVAIGAFALFLIEASEQVAHAGVCGMIGFKCCLPDDPPPCRQGVCLPDPDPTDVLSGGGAGVDFICQPCGGEGQFCCDQEKCNSGFTCLSECDARGTDQGSGAWDCTETLDGRGSGAGVLSTCEPCGDLGEPCCDESACNGDNLICGSEFCEACGTIGEQCCPNDMCPGGGLCIDGKCDPARAPVMGNMGVLMLTLSLASVAFLGLRRVASS